MKLFGRGGGLDNSQRIFKKTKRLRVSTSRADQERFGVAYDDEEGHQRERGLDDWASPFPDDPNESVRVIHKNPTVRRPKQQPQPRLNQDEDSFEEDSYEPDVQLDVPADEHDYQGDDQLPDLDSVEEPEPIEPAPDQAADQEAPTPDLDSEEPDSARPQRVEKTEPPREDPVSKYGGKFANIGQVPSSSHRNREASSAASRPHYGRGPNGGYNGFARRLGQTQTRSEEEERPAEAPAVAPQGTFEAVVPMHDRLTPEEYDEGVRWQDRFGTEVGIYRSNLIAATAHRIADIGCASGRLALYLAEWGFDVVGIDADPQMIATAQNLVPEHLEAIEHAQGGISFYEGSMGNLTTLFDRGSIDGVLCVGDVLTSLDSLEELRQVLLDMGELITPDGVFIASFVNYRKLSYQRSRAGEPQLIETDNGTRLYLDLYDYPAGGTHVNVERLLGKRGPDGAWRMSAVTSRHLIITSDMLSRELIDAGFDVIETAGAYDGSRVSPLESDSIMVVARKRRRARPQGYR